MTSRDTAKYRQLVISTHTSLAGRDLKSRSSRSRSFISTHTSLAGRDVTGADVAEIMDISTHTSLAGRDGFFSTHKIGNDISTHTSLAGRDQFQNPKTGEVYEFLLTRPSRDVTLVETMLYYR